MGGIFFAKITTAIVLLIQDKTTFNAEKEDPHVITRKSNKTKGKRLFDFLIMYY